MFKALKEFFFGKPAAPVAETPAPYKVEAPVAEVKADRAVATETVAAPAKAKAAKPKKPAAPKKAAPAKKPAAPKKPAAKKAAKPAVKK